MKYISKATLDVDDLSNLAYIEEPHQTNHKHLKVVYENKNELKNSYINYIFFARKNRLLDVPQNSIIQRLDKKSFFEHYSKPKKFSNFINEFRRNTRSGFCYMCGALNAGTLDHFLPKDLYPEFSFFSKNLIPSCDCNSKKKIDLSSVLNPHFYEECDSELYSLDIVITSTSPKINFEYKILVNNNIPKIQSIVDNHLKNHLLKYSDISNYMRNHIMMILMNPIDAFAIKRKINRAEIYDRVQDQVDITKFLAKSDNRWDVILYKGFLKTDLIDFIEIEVNKKFP